MVKFVYNYKRKEGIKMANAYYRSSNSIERQISIHLKAFTKESKVLEKICKIMFLLLSTGNAKITHKAGRDSDVYPAKVYTKHLTTIRAMLQKGEL
jgi:hypothetical protein